MGGGTQTSYLFLMIYGMQTKQNINLQVGHEGVSTSYCDILFVCTQWSCKGIVLGPRKYFLCIHSVREMMNGTVIS